MHRVGGLAEHPVDGDVVVAAGRVHREDRLEGRDLHRIDAHGSRDWVPAELLDELGPAHDDPSLRAAEQLVTRAEHEAGAIGERVGHARLVGRHPVAVREQARSDVVEERHTALVGERGQVFGARLGREPDHAVVRGVHLQDRAGPLGGGRPVVADPRAVRGSHLDELGARGTHDVGDPELAPDLDQLSARDQDLPALGEGRECQHEGRRAIVHDKRVLGAGEGDQQFLGARPSPAALAGLALDLEVGVGGGGPGCGARRVRGQRRAPEVRMQDHPGRVDHGGEAGGDAGGPLTGAGEDVVGGGRFGAGRRGSGRARLAERDSQAALQEGPAERCRRAPARFAPEERVHRRQGTACVGHAGEPTARGSPRHRPTTVR